MWPLVRTQDDLFLTDEFRALEKEFDNFKYIPALSNAENDDTWDGEKGLVTDVVMRHFDSLEGYEAYLCGSPGMIDACIACLGEADLHDEFIYYDKFS